MATWPIWSWKDARPGKRPHLPDVQTNDDKRRLYEKEKCPERSFQPKSKEMWLMSMRIQTIWRLLLMRISQTGPENNSALQNQNTENMSDEEEDDETID